jgi:hypothetical protein
MGTNFYFGKRGIHIGKRSAAGPYCWDCGVTLCDSASDHWERRTRYGQDAVHFGNGDGWLDSCPICGGTANDESIESSSAGRELGFNKSAPAKKVGVASCSSFSWAMSPKEFQHEFLRSRKRIFDEYGRKYTRDEFRDVLSECPIKSYSSVGHEFF